MPDTKASEGQRNLHLKRNFYKKGRGHEKEQEREKKKKKYESRKKEGLDDGSR
jgi:hypothetical protein